jgi:hypothetical protein
MHPVLEEICRIYQLGQVQNTSFRRWQRLLRDEVQPMLDQLVVLEQAHGTLQQEHAALKAELEKSKTRGKKEPVTA